MLDVMQTIHEVYHVVCRSRLSARASLHKTRDRRGFPSNTMMGGDLRRGLTSWCLIGRRPSHSGVSKRASRNAPQLSSHDLPPSPSGPRTDRRILITVASATIDASWFWAVVNAWQHEYYLILSESVRVINKHSLMEIIK